MVVAEITTCGAIVTVTDGEYGSLLSVWGEKIIFFCIFIFYVLIGVLLKGMVESSLLSEDELLIPDIDEVMAL